MSHIENNDNDDGAPLVREVNLRGNKRKPEEDAWEDEPAEPAGTSASDAQEFALSPDELTEEPETVNSIFQLLGGRLMGGHGMMQREAPHDDMPEQLKELHPYSTSLGITDVESCIKLESATSDPSHACSREMITYHLSNAGELSFGLFTSADASSPHSDAATAETAKPVDSSVPTRKGILLAQVIATKSSNELPMDADFVKPRPGDGPETGHDEQGRTIIIQTLAVVPKFQGRGLGTILLKAYIQRMGDSLTADRISLLVNPERVGFYTQLGFENRGTSNAQRANGHLIAMCYDFREHRSEDDM